MTEELFCRNNKTKDNSAYDTLALLFNPGSDPDLYVASPAEQPDLLGARQSFTELVFLWGVSRALKLVPGKLPLFLPASSHSLAVDYRPQVGVDAESHIHTQLFSLHQDCLIFKFSWLFWTVDIFLPLSIFADILNIFSIWSTFMYFLPPGQTWITPKYSLYTVMDVDAFRTEFLHQRKPPSTHFSHLENWSRSSGVSLVSVSTLFSPGFDLNSTGPAIVES